MIPHFALPFRFSAGAAVEVDQDSPDEITACVEATLRTPLGFREDNPHFGTADQVFLQGGVDSASVQSALLRCEPRADTEVQRLALDHIAIDVRRRDGR